MITIIIVIIVTIIIMITIRAGVKKGTATQCVNVQHLTQGLSASKLQR